MRLDNDSKAFLITFEWVLMSTQWPPEHWTLVLAPCVTSPAQAVYRRLDSMAIQDYSLVKMAVLDFLDISEEMHCCTIQLAKCIYDHIKTIPGQWVRERLQLLPWKFWSVVQEELQAILDLGVSKESQSDWCSPIILIPQPSSTHFCTDFRKVNAISKFRYKSY